MITCTFEKGYKDNLRHLVVHALVVKDGKILLAKRSGDILETGKWNIPGGFLQRDETAAGGVLRELYEETGWEGEIISLFRINSKPHRPREDRQNVILEYLIKPLKFSGKPDNESSKVEWIPFDKLLPFDDYAFDHGESIKLLLKYLKSTFPLPLVE
jgi:ADP-ribose pyrophosphatase YjhB (NUDIX family)